jgi:hypothetical protein
MIITKADGKKEEFNEEKFRRSLSHAGAEPETVDYVTKHILEELHEGMSTTEIYKHAFEVLKKEGKKPVAARYSLKRAMMDLGPSGFPFEIFLGEIFKEKGYQVETDITIFGKCASHEIDVLAWNEKEFFVIEAKFHNQAGIKSDLKVALYVKARYDDLHANNFDGRLKEGQKCRCAIYTNTDFTDNAYKYSECVDMEVVSWTRPQGRGLDEMIEETALHPLTAITTLSDKEKMEILNSGKVLCRDIQEDPQILKGFGLNQEKISEVTEEVRTLCVPRR